MFSGITNQVSSLSSLFSKHNEENPATASQPVEEGQQPQESVPVIENVENNNAENVSGEKQSPTKASGGMFSNVTGKVSGWLPSSLPTVSMPSVSMPTMPTVSMPAMPSIPGLRKAHPTEGAEGTETVPEQAEEAQPSQTANEKDDDDRSSATGGADSRPVSEKGSPTEEQSGAVENVTHKVTAGAKSFGSFLSGVVNKAGDKIKETVKHNPILGEFNKEQEAFIKDQSGKNTEAGVCPWIGHKNEDKIKEEVFSLSSDRRNFVRAPPAGSDFEFNYDTSYPTAVALMAEDPSLEKMRFDLVPKIITEENFWRNYFYRVSLIVQAGELGTLGTDDAFGKRGEEDDDVTTKKSLKNSSTKDSSNKKVQSKLVSDKRKAKSDKDMQNIQEKLETTTVDKKSPRVEKTSGDEEEWEKNLAAEDFEVVDDQNVDESELDLDLK